MDKPSYVSFPFILCAGGFGARENVGTVFLPIGAKFTLFTPCGSGWWWRHKSGTVGTSLPSVGAADLFSFPAWCNGGLGRTVEPGAGGTCLFSEGPFDSPSPYGGGWYGRVNSGAGVVAADSSSFTAYNGGWCGRVGLGTVGTTGRAFVTKCFTPYGGDGSVKVDWGE